VKFPPHKTLTKLLNLEVSEALPGALNLFGRQGYPFGRIGTECCWRVFFIFSGSMELLVVEGIGGCHQPPKGQVLTDD